MSMRNRFGSFQNTPFKFLTPGRSFRNRNKNTNNNNNVANAGSNDTRRDGRSNRSNQPQSLGQERLPPGQDSTTFLGSIFDSLVELDCLKNFHLTSIILGPFRYLTNFFGILPLTKQMQYSAILFAISLCIFYNNLPGGQSIPPPPPQSPHQSLSSRNGQIKKRGGRNSQPSSSLSIFRFIILLISLVTMIFSLFIFISALIKVISNYFNNNEEDLLLPHLSQQQNGMRQSSSYLSEMEMPINMANSNKQRLHRHHHNTQQRYSSSSQQNAHLIHNRNHNHNLGGYDRLGRPNDIYYAPTGDQYERLLTVPEMRRMQQQRAAASGGSGGAGIVGSSTYHEQKEFEEHTGLGSHGRRNLQSLSPNRKLALDPHATVDRESMERELNKDAVKLDIINQQFGRVSPPKLRHQRSQYSSNSNVTGGDLNSSTGASGVLNSPQNSYSRSRSKTRSPRLAFMNFGDSARSSGIGGISAVGGGMSVVSGTTGAGSRGSRGSRARGVPSVAETDLAIAKTMAELRQEATPISRVLGGMKFTPAPHNLHNMDLLATPMNRKYNHGHGHHGRSRTPTGTKSRLHMNRIDENPAPMSIDKSLISGVGASGGSTMSRSKDDSFVINRRFIAPTNLKNQYFPQQNQLQQQQQHRQMMNNNNNNSNNMNDINRQRAQYDAMLNDRGMYGNVNLRMNRIDPNAPASLAVQQQRQQQLEQQQRLQMQQQEGLISPFDGKFEKRMPLSPFSRQTELDQMKKQQSHESRFMQKYGIGSSRSTGSGKYVGNSGSQHRSDFIAEYLERSSKLYENLDIDTQIHHWSSNMRWWMSDKLKEKYDNWCQNNKHIDELFVHLNQWFPNNRQHFSQYSATLEKKVEFVLGNDIKLGEISRERNAPLIQSIVATRKSIKENADKIDPNTKYIFHRLTEFCDSTNLNEFQWNSGGTTSREHGWRADLYPTDGELLFGIFCEYMDAIFCPGFKFSDKHFIKGCKQDEMNELKIFGRYFKDVAIVEVLPNVIRRRERENDKINSRDNYTSFNRDRLKRERERDRRRQLLESNTNNNFDDTTGDLPYYFIIYDKDKFDESIKDFIQTNQENIANNRNLNGIRKPKAYLSSKGGKHDRRRNKSDSFEDDYYGKKKRKYDSVRRRNASSNSSNGLGGNIPARKDYVSKVSAWYPIPGKDNVFHCLVLLAFFLQRFNNSELRGVKLKDRNCDLLMPLQR